MMKRTFSQSVLFVGASTLVAIGCIGAYLAGERIGFEQGITARLAAIERDSKIAQGWTADPKVRQ